MVGGQSQCCVLPILRDQEVVGVEGGEVLPPIGGRGIRAKGPRSQGRATTCAKEARDFPEDSDVEHRAPFGDRGGPITGGDAGGASREDVMGGGPPTTIAIHHQRGQDVFFLKQNIKKNKNL